MAPIKNFDEFNKTEQLIKIFKKCSISNFKEIKNFHPDGESMPNGISFQRGGYIKECIENKNSFILDEGVHNKQYGLKKYRGGIIVFSTDVNVISDEKGFNKIKKKFENFWKTLINRIFVDKKIEKARRNFNNSNDENFYAYSIGHCFRGKYQSDNNKVYDDEKFGDKDLKNTKGIVEFHDVKFKYRDDEDLTQSYYVKQEDL